MIHDEGDGAMLKMARGEDWRQRNRACLFTCFVFPFSSMAAAKGMSVDVERGKLNQRP